MNINEIKYLDAEEKLINEFIVKYQITRDSCKKLTKHIIDFDLVNRLILISNRSRTIKSVYAKIRYNLGCYSNSVRPPKNNNNKYEIFNTSNFILFMQPDMLVGFDNLDQVKDEIKLHPELWIVPGVQYHLYERRQIKVTTNINIEL